MKNAVSKCNSEDIHMLHNSLSRLCSAISYFNIMHLKSVTGHKNDLFTSMQRINRRNHIIKIFKNLFPQTEYVWSLDVISD